MNRAERAQFLAQQQSIFDRRHPNGVQEHQRIYECTSAICVRTGYRITGGNKCWGCQYARRKW